MAMDTHFDEFSDTIAGFEFDDGTVLPGFGPSQNLADEFNLEDGTSNLKFMYFPLLPQDPNHFNFPPSSTASSEIESPDDLSDGILKYINQILMEENMEEKPSMFPDPLALHATEKSLYEIIGENNLHLPDQPFMYFDQNVESPSDNMFGSSSQNSSNTSTTSSNSVDPQWIVDQMSYQSPIIQNNSLFYSPSSTFGSNSLWSFSNINSLSDSVSGSFDSSVSVNPVSNIFSNSETILQYKRGMEEASKFLPSGNQLLIDLDSYELPQKTIKEAPKAEVKVDKDEKGYGSRGRKNHLREDDDFEEERNSKQTAVYVEEAELSEMFDKVLLFKEVKGQPLCCDVDVESPNVRPGSSGGKTRSRKQADEEEDVDLSTLLTNCAQSVASDDRTSAYEQLKQIRQRSSSTGDATQRLAFIFANGLEARLAGTGSQSYAALASKRISAVQKLKAYQIYLSACPFKKMAILLANKTILDLAAKDTNKTLHVIDFGILYGFQWPILIQLLSKIPGGPPKLRITGIEVPQPGFRPAELVEETGRRLAGYCCRFNVPFEYNAKVQKWEDIKIEDLKIHSDELVAVNCLLRFQNLLDETIDENSLKDTVLKLIRKMNPDIFIHSIINGSYNSPFFVTRFREALFHYSASFDMLDVILPREDQERMNLEKEFYGREIMNIIACEGSERVVRPEKYKQWRARTIGAGFRVLPLDQELMKKLREKVKAGYHKDFVIDEDGQWMLQGWKGRILYASSCWVPA